ncbi:MAG: hypothetical protein H0V68_09295 [Actinobacteria bacterium]|nr:hypothetical protein [Actinomycetota bacterium]
MDPRFRIVALVAAALGLLVSLFLALRPSDDEAAPPPPTTTEVTTTSQVPTATATGTTGSEGPGTIHIDYEIVGGRPVGGIARDLSRAAASSSSA